MKDLLVVIYYVAAAVGRSDLAFSEKQYAHFSVREDWLRFARQCYHGHDVSIDLDWWQSLPEDDRTAIVV